MPKGIISHEDVRRGIPNKPITRNDRTRKIVASLGTLGDQLAFSCGLLRCFNESGNVLLTMATGHGTTHTMTLGSCIGEIYTHLARARVKIPDFDFADDIAPTTLIQVRTVVTRGGLSCLDDAAHNGSQEYVCAGHFTLSFMYVDGDQILQQRIITEGRKTSHAAYSRCYCGDSTSSSYRATAVSLPPPPVLPGEGEEDDREMTPDENDFYPK